MKCGEAVEGMKWGWAGAVRRPGSGLACALDNAVMSTYLAFMRNNEIIVAQPLLAGLKAVASPVRLAILDYLKRPSEHFPPQTDGDFLTDGVCADFIRDKLGIAAATASRHLTLLTDAGLLRATRKKGWTFYRRDEAAIKAFIQQLQTNL